MRQRSPSIALALAVLLVPCAAACSSTGEAPARSVEAAGGEAADDADALERRVAELGLAVAQSEAEQELREARQEVEKAERGLAEAQRALQHFHKTASALELEDASIELREARGDLEDAEAELRELEAMYAEEEFATKTKELVLARGKRQLEVARRKALLREQRFAALEGHELPRKERELVAQLRAAELALENARGKLATAQLEADVAILEARKTLAELDEDDDED